MKNYFRANIRLTVFLRLNSTRSMAISLYIKTLCL